MHAFRSVGFHSSRVIRFSSVTKQLHLPAFLQKRVLEWNRRKVVVLDRGVL